MVLCAVSFNGKMKNKRLCLHIAFTLYMYMNLHKTWDVITYPGFSLGFNIHVHVYFFTSCIQDKYNTTV